VPTAVTDLPLKTDPPRKRWTREEYEALSAVTLGQERLELVQGELISKMGKKRPHVIALNLVRGWLVSTFGLPFVNSEAPIDVSHEDNPTNEPEPDLIVLNRHESEFLRSNPRPSDLLLVIEIADTTLGFDLTTKARLYARAEIAEYWVLDLSGRRLIVHRDPLEGQYRTVSGYEENESVAPLAASSSELRIRDVIPGVAL
jgi:Uma2 family endonuclease